MERWLHARGRVASGDAMRRQLVRASPFPFSDFTAEDEH